MSKKGGYLIIDLENIDLMTQNNLFSTKKVESLYKLLKSNYHKNVIISGIKINGIEKNDCVTNIHYTKLGTADIYAFKIYGIYVDILNTPNEGYGITTENAGLGVLTGTTDETGSIKINYSDFEYRDNLCVAIQHATGTITVAYSVFFGDLFSEYVIFNDGTVKITISPESYYYTIKVTGGTVNGLNYEVYYLG